MRALTLLAIAIILPVQAKDKPLAPDHMRMPWMNGAELLRKLNNAAETGEAVGYLKAVADMTADRDWCYSQSKPGSAQLQPVVTDKLHTLSVTQAQRSAAALAMEAWREQWPCPSVGCCHD